MTHVFNFTPILVFSLRSAIFANSQPFRERAADTEAVAFAGKRLGGKWQSSFISLLFLDQGEIWSFAKLWGRFPLPPFLKRRQLLWTFTFCWHFPFLSSSLFLYNYAPIKEGNNRKRGGGKKIRHFLQMEMSMYSFKDCAKAPRIREKKPEKKSRKLWWISPKPLAAPKDISSPSSSPPGKRDQARRKEKKQEEERGKGGGGSIISYTPHFTLFFRFLATHESRAVVSSLFLLWTRASSFFFFFGCKGRDLNYDFFGYTQGG